MALKGIFGVFSFETCISLAQGSRETDGAFMYLPFIWLSHMCTSKVQLDLLPVYISWVATDILWAPNLYLLDSRLPIPINLLMHIASLMLLCETECQVCFGISSDEPVHIEVTTDQLLQENSSLLSLNLIQTSGTF